ncbi:MAG: branched-chain amino acid ABC transporter permease [Pseudomonadota bacterium]
MTRFCATPIWRRECMEILLQQIINAISLGGVYAMLALGLAIVFSIVRLINFAHGEIMTFGGYGIFLSLAFGFPPLGALAIGVSAAVVMALAMERTAFRAMRGADVVTLLITSFAVSEILKVLFQNGISARPVPITFPASWSGTYQIGTLTFGVAPTVSIVVAMVAFGGLTFVLRRTTTGIAMRAAAEDLEMLRLLGVRANRVIAVAFALSGLLAGIAAVVWTSQRGSVDPMMGFFPVLKAFIATVLGGLGSLGGAVLGGFVIGALEVLTQAFLPSALSPFRDAIVLAVVIGALLLRPNGLLPTAVGERS